MSYDVIAAKTIQGQVKTQEKSKLQCAYNEKHDNKLFISKR